MGDVKAWIFLAKAMSSPDFVNESKFLGLPFDGEEVQVHSMNQLLLVGIRDDNLGNFMEEIAHRDDMVKKMFASMKLLICPQ